MSVSTVTSNKNKTEFLSVPDIRLRQNNFDLLRFLFAFIVFLVHAYVLSGAENLSILNKLLSSEIAVKSFFVVSGFLIFMSYENSSDIKSYFMKRVRRIYPAYCFIVIACAVMGGVFSAYSWTEYLSLPVLKYVVVNLAFLNFSHSTLPGLFEGNSLQAVNGALWTLKIEVLFYLFVPLAVIAFRKLGRIAVITLLYISSIIYSVVMIELARRTGDGIYVELQRQLPGQLTFFIAGAAGYYYFQYLAKYGIYLMWLAVGAFAFKASLPWLMIEPIALGVLVVYFACLFPYMGNFGKYGDFSYGIYIVHFPILQVLVSFGLFKDSPLLALVTASLLIISMSFLLWHLIEKRFLRKASHYVEVSHG